MSAESRPDHDRTRQRAARALLRAGLRAQARPLAVGVVFLSLHQLTEVLVPVVIGLTIDRAVATGDVVALAWCIGGLVALFTALRLCWRTGARAVQAAELGEAHRLRTAVAERLLHPAGVRTGRATGELVSIASGDADTTASAIESRAQLVAAGVAITGTTVLLLSIDTWLGLIVLAGAPLVLFILQGLGPIISRRSEAAQQAAGRTAALATDLVRGLRALRGIGATGPSVERYRTASRATLTAALRAATATSAQAGAGVALSGLFLAVVTAVAGLRALDGAITVGELITVVGLAQFVAEPVSTLVFAARESAVARGSARRVAELLSAPASSNPTEPNPTCPSPTGSSPTGSNAAGSNAAGSSAAWSSAAWSSDNASTGETDTAASPEAPAIALIDVHAGPLRGLTLHVPAGRLIGVVGDDPRDAVTLRALLTREQTLPAGAGQVRVFGRSVDTMPLDELRRRVLVEPHDTDLFASTVADNLRAHPAPPVDPGAPGSRPGPVASGAPSRVAAPTLEHPALRASAADEFISGQPAGLDQAIAHRGATLSGGQRQRLALARALLADPEVLVLSEPTTAVDAATEARIAAGVRRLRHADPSAPRTTVLITNSPTLLAVADEVVLVVDGVVQARGSHADLVAARPDYRELVWR